MSLNCPICNKAGLPDYTKDSVVCPQCNSDLKAFLLLKAISKPRKSRTTTYLLIGISLLSLTFLMLFLKSSSDRDGLIAQNDLLVASIAKTQNKDSINAENDRQRSTVEKSYAVVKYVVKKGDCPFKIAHYFYGNGSKYKQIEEDNSLEQPYVLKPGQILNIKISQ